MSDSIDRQMAIGVLLPGKEILNRVLDDTDVVGTDREKYSWGIKLIEMYIDAINELPPVQPEYKLDEWCEDCKEYDHERHCCPRFNRVIRETLKDAQPEIIHCEDCEWWEKLKDSIQGRCALMQMEPTGAWYCGNAQRKGDLNV